MNVSKERLKRVVIIGNSGSGKSFLAQKLGILLQQEIIHFDKLFWEPGSFNQRRPKDIVYREIEKLSSADSWIMEGVFGDMAALAIPKATGLIFMNKSWEECESALLLRGSESSKQLDSATAEKNFKELLSWAKAYSSRETMASFTGHQRLFSEFSGWKLQIIRRIESDELLNLLRLCTNN